MRLTVFTHAFLNPHTGHTKVLTSDLSGDTPASNLTDGEAQVLREVLHSV